MSPGTDITCIIWPKIFGPHTFGHSVYIIAA